MDRNFKEDLKRGLEAEKIVSEILTAKGILNFPLCQFDGATNGNGGPKIWGYNSGLLCPDIICFHPTGKTFFIEVKSRTHARTYLGQKEYTLSEVKYNCYLKVQQLTGAPVWLAFYDEQLKTVFLGKIDEYTRSWDGKKGDEVINSFTVYYWDVNDLKALYKPRPAEIKSFF